MLPLSPIIFDYTIAKKMDRLGGFTGVGDFSLMKPMKIGGMLVYCKAELARPILPTNQSVRCEFQTGFVRYRFDQSFGATLEFVPNASGLMFFDFRGGIKSSFFTIRGNIVQMASSDSLVVSFYPKGLPDRVSYSQTISSTGNFAVTWFPPVDDNREWMIRLTAILNQSSIPIVINGLSIERDRLDYPQREGMAWQGVWLGRVEDAGVLPLERIWADREGGYVANRFYASPPAYDTIDFVPRRSGRLFYDFQCGLTNLAIVVKGNITQMAAGDSITVQFYPRGLPDQVAFSQDISSTGEFQVIWTPPRRGEWIVRVAANFNQTSLPITITNFKIERATGVGTGGGGGVNIQVSDQMSVMSSETVATQLSLNQIELEVIAGAEQVNQDVIAAITDTGMLLSTDSAVAQFNLLSSELLQVLASEAIQSSLQTSVSEVMQASVQDTVLQQLLASPSETVRVSTAESILSSISVATTDATQVRTDESQVAQVGVGVSESLRISASEQATPVISFELTESQQVLASEGISVFTGFQLLVSDSMQVTTLESQSTNIAAQIVQQELIQTSEAQTTQLGVSVADSASVSSAESIIPALQPRVSETIQVSASESQSISIAINFTQQESLRVSEAPSTQIGIEIADQVMTVASEIASQTIIPQIAETMRISASEQPSVAVQVSAATTAQVRTTESVSPSVQLAASETGQVLASESSSAQIAGLISEIIRVSTSEQTTTQVQFSAVESVTQIEVETAPFIGLIQRLMIPVSIDLLKAVELSVSITQVSLDLGMD
jgi:hypothetical protein